MRAPPWLGPDNVLTTTVDGLWALQVLTGVEVLAPELGLRPHLPSVEPKQLAWQHPVTSELQAVGVIDASGTVDSTVLEWLTVLSRRDIALFMQFGTPAAEEPARVLLARFAQWWVAMERSADLVRISGAGTASSEGTASGALTSQIERLCGTKAPAALRPVTLDADAMLASATSRDALRRFLDTQRLEPDQVQRRWQLPSTPSDRPRPRLSRSSPAWKRAVPPGPTSNRAW
jgi:EspG family